MITSVQHFDDEALSAGSTRTGQAAFDPPRLQLSATYVRFRVRGWQAKASDLERGAARLVLERRVNFRSLPRAVVPPLRFGCLKNDPFLMGQRGAQG